MKSIMRTPLGKAIFFMLASIIISILLRIFGYIFFIFDNDYLLTAIPVLIVILVGWWLKRIYLFSKLLFIIATILFITVTGIIILSFLFSFSSEILTYRKVKEPKTQRVFVVQSYQNMFNKGTVQLYEAHGPLLKKIKGEYYSGEFSADEPYTYISDDGKQIIVSFFFMGPVFSVPMKKE